jgi:NAD(P)-dependent dehydrogenase (short-subunit alcohol dehydrogenase family)
MTAGSGKSVFIVGAGPGLGAAIAARFAEAGYAIGLIARDERVLQQQEADLIDRGVTCFTAVADVSEPIELRSALDTLEAALGVPDVVLANTSMFVEGQPTEIDPDTFETVWKVVCLSALITLQQVVPGMCERGSGTFLMPGTPLALKPWPPGSALGAAKAAARNLLINASEELRPAGINVAVVTIDGVIGSSPAFEPTQIADHFFHVAGLESTHWQGEHTYTE